jgi:hypothetical protein
MDKRTKSVCIFLIGSVVLVIVIFVGRDLYLRSAHIIQCADGPRKRIDSREFSTTYWAYAAEFEASIGNKAKFSGKLDPKQLQELTEAAQQAGEFRKYLVAGYNACAISKAQYAKDGKSFQALDSLSRQINSLASQPTLSALDKSALGRLVREYIDLASNLATEDKQ